MMDDIIYFEIGDKKAGKSYPGDEPFMTWCDYDNSDLYFNNEEFVKSNKLCIVALSGQTTTWLVTAKKDWVLANCPKLLSDDTYTIVYTHHGTRKNVTEDLDFKHFLRFPDENGDVYGSLGDKFLQYSEENIGITDRFI